MSYPDLLNEQTQLAVKDVLTDEDKTRLRELHETFDTYRKHPLGEVMRHWHDLGCEVDSHAAYLEYRGEDAEIQRSKAQCYHQRAESTRLKIDSEVSP